MPRSLVVLVFLVDCILCIMSQGSPRMWEEMSDLEKMNRLKDLQRRIFFDIKNQGGGGSGYGAPNDGYGVPAAPPSYNAPAPKPSYNAPAPKPSYNAPAPKPSYNARPSYGGGNKGKKVLEIPVPNLPIPDPIDFKAGVLRSKGRIASGLFHAKAGLLRAGANLLAQKANSLDKFAQAIPGLNAKVIQKLQGLKKGGGGGGGYGAPPSPGYGGPQPPPSNTYGTPPKQNPGYNGGGGGGGGGNFNTASAPNLGNTFNSGSSISAGNSYSSGGSSGNFNSGGSNFNSGGSSFNSNSGGSSFNSGSGLSSVGLTASNSYNSGGNNFNSGGGNSFNSGSNSNFNSGAQQVQTNFKPSNGDSYGNPVGNVITSNSNSNNNFNGNSASIPVGSSLSFGGNNNNNNNNKPNYNGGNNNFNSGNSNSGFSGGNSNSGFSNSNSGINNSNNGFSGSNSLDSYGGSGNSGNNNQGSVLAGVNPRANPATSSVDQGLLVLENGNDFTPLIESTLEQLMHGGGVTSNSVRNIRNEAERLLLQESRDLSVDPATCKAESRSLANLLEDIFMGNEVIPDVIDEPPLYPLDLTYKTIRTFPGMRLTADMTRFKPMLKWPAQPDSLYTVVISNLDINSRKNRTLSEFWHWFVANIPGDSVDDGEVVFDLLFPLVLPEGDGDHRYGYFVFEQPRQLDYGDEGGPTDACSPQMSNGRGPFKSTKNFMRKYNLKLTAATFIILDSNEASMEIACEWQKCIGNTINLVSPLQCSKK